MSRECSDKNGPLSILRQTKLASLQYSIGCLVSKTVKGTKDKAVFLEVSEGRLDCDIGIDC